MTNNSPNSTATIPLHGPLLRGSKRPRVALVGRAGSGKSTIFEDAASPVVRREPLTGPDGAYRECIVDVGLDQVALIDLPSLGALHPISAHEQATFLYLLWGERIPAAARAIGGKHQAGSAAPDVLVHVMDATALERELELTLELNLFGRPMVIALNRVDEARKKGIYINVETLGEKLGIPVIPTIAHMGKGLVQLFETVVKVAREKTCPLPQPPARHIAESLRPLAQIVATPEIDTVFHIPRALLVSQLADNDAYFVGTLTDRFPELSDRIAAARERVEQSLPRPLPEELHADRHHRAATLYESVSSPRGSDAGEGWRHRLDELFLHPRWGLLGSLLVFATVLLIVFEISAFIDSMTSARLAAWVTQWHPDTTTGIVGKAVADGLVGLLGIVAPYMLPLVILLVTLEETGIMHRVAFVVDRGFHRVGLHGGVAVPFLISQGCNVPAISAAASTGSRRERIVAATLITFVPCSARSAIILAIGGKYLGGIGVFAIFMLTLLVIAALGKVLSRRFPGNAAGLVQVIPPYSLPDWRRLWRKTKERTSDIVTIVTPLLVAGSIVLALLGHWGADRLINTMLIPVTNWWLGLPAVLGVPILFGVLRKELSMLMIYQALGSLDIGPLLNPIQIFTFLVFLTFYVPCLSTFAVMQRCLGRKEAWRSVFNSLIVALLVAGFIRLVLEASRFIGGMTWIT